MSQDMSQIDNLNSNEISEKMDSYIHDIKLDISRYLWIDSDPDSDISEFKFCIQGALCYSMLESHANLILRKIADRHILTTHCGQMQFLIDNIRKKMENIERWEKIPKIDYLAGIIKKSKQKIMNKNLSPFKEIESLRKIRNSILHGNYIHLEYKKTENIYNVKFDMIDELRQYYPWSLNPILIEGAKFDIRLFFERKEFVDWARASVKGFCYDLANEFPLQTSGSFSALNVLRFDLVRPLLNGSEVSQYISMRAT
jgi:hypothetical protein